MRHEDNRKGHEDTGEDNSWLTRGGEQEGDQPRHRQQPYHAPANVAHERNPRDDNLHSIINTQSNLNGVI